MEKAYQQEAIKKANFHSSPLAFYKGLQMLDNAAICHLHQKIQKHIEAKSSFCKVTSEDAEEMTNDSVLIVLQKIMDGGYLFQGFNPLTFSFIVADNLLRNFCRKKRIYCQTLEEVDMPRAPEVEANFAKKELEQNIGKAMSALSPSAQQIIRLKYFDGMKDAEVVEKNLTIYSTVNSLKNRRCQSLKKLATSALLKQAALSVGIMPIA